MLSDTAVRQALIQHRIRLTKLVSPPRPLSLPRLLLLYLAGISTFRSDRFLAQGLADFFWDAGTEVLSVY